MKKTILNLLLLLLCNSVLLAQNFEFSAEDVDLSYQKHVLPNGLTLLIYEDHKAPIVAVNVWYHVGSKNEKLGKSGLKELEELM